MGKYLSTKQQKAIAILLDEGTVEDLRKQLKLRWSTILRWRNQPEFIERLEECKRTLAEDVDYIKENRMQTLSCRVVYAIQHEISEDFASTKMIDIGLNILKQVGKTPKRLETTGNDQKRSKTVKNMCEENKV